MVKGVHLTDTLFLLQDSPFPTSTSFSVANYLRDLAIDLDVGAHVPNAFSTLRSQLLFLDRDLHGDHVA